MKAITPLIATVFLVAVTLTIATIIISWTSMFAEKETKIIKDREDTKIKCSGAGLSIENVRYNCTTGKISLDAYNSGQVKLEDFRFVIILTNLTTYTWYANNDTLSSGDTVSFYNITYNLSLTSTSQIDKLMFISNTCPLMARNERTGTKVTGDNC